jgi:hypothetical protein
MKIFVKHNKTEIEINEADTQTTIKYSYNEIKLLLKEICINVKNMEYNFKTDIEQKKPSS